MEKSKKRILIIGILLTLLVTIGTSYALWTTTAVQSGINEIQSDCLSLTLEEGKELIHLENAFPLTDEEAAKLTPYTFTIKNNCNTSVNYTVKLEKLQKENEELLESSNIAVKFNNAQKQILSDYPKGKSTYPGDDATSVEARELIKGTIKGNETRDYQLKLWMDEHVTAEEDVMDKIFRSKIVIDGEMSNLVDYTEPILHGADPILEQNEVAEAQATNTKLIPVTIDEEKGIVTRANTKEEWYNYEEKRWANAVILADGAEEPEVGQEIKEEHIESYFVWIPKYRYKIFDMGNYENANGEIDENKQNKAIEIEFGLEDTNDTNTSCTTSETSSASKCAVDKWMTHPAFTAFSNSHGMWVGKFETSKTDANTIQIKPNVSSWRNTTVGNSFNVAKSYNSTLLSHMMKNTEWGAVAYLTQSVYGRCENDSCKEVAINSNQDYKTGYENNDKAWPVSQNASTTGNNTGIYDMSGGAWEYVAGVMTNKSNISNLTLNDIQFGNAGELTTESITDLKYIDLYTQGTETQYSRRILGDATGETGPFNKKDYNINSYLDESYFVNLENSWFQRGGGNGNSSSSGIFAFSHYSGINYDTLTFRVVLIP